MSNHENSKILLFGLDETLSSELETVLANQEQVVHARPFRSPQECLSEAERLGANLIFCSSDREQYLPLLEAVGRRRPDLPVVIVSRDPEVSEWLDAIEAGACDYCAAPFEASHVRWILESALRQPSAPVAYRTAG